MASISRSARGALTLALTLAAALCAGPATAEITNCTAITSLPATIAVQGIYCFTGHLATSSASGTAITINVPNVTIDLNGWKLGGAGAGTGTLAIGIQSSQANVVIRNGIVRGFRHGIQLSGRDAVVEDMLVDSNTVRGIYVSGFGAIVRRNTVADTGGGTAADDQVHGITVEGAESRLLNNDVRETSRNAAGAAQAAFGVRFFGSAGVAEGNRITNSQDYGLYSSNNGAVFMVGNRITNESSLPGTTGLRMNAGTSSLYRDNTVAGFTTPYSGGTDAGNNQSLP